MQTFTTVLAHLIAAAIAEVPAGGDLAATLARAAPGDVIRLGPGIHTGTLAIPPGVRVQGAGAAATRVVAPEGADTATPAGDAELAALTLVARAPRCALIVRQGNVRGEDVVLEGGACGVRIEGGTLKGARMSARGRVGVHVAAGALELEDARIRGTDAGVAVHGGRAELRRTVVDGPFREAGVTAEGGMTRLEGVVIRAPGPAGIAAEGGATVEGVGLVVAGAGGVDGIPGACVQVRRATLRLEGATLVRCDGAAVEAEGGTLALSAVDASGGLAGCFVIHGGSAELTGNVCAGHGPGLVLAAGARASLRLNRWWTDPVLWVDCGSGARAELGAGESGRATCGGSP
jgi:hypothetical protein